MENLVSTARYCEFVKMIQPFWWQLYSYGVWMAGMQFFQHNVIFTFYWQKEYWRNYRFHPEIFGFANLQPFISMEKLNRKTKTIGSALNKAKPIIPHSIKMLNISAIPIRRKYPHNNFNTRLHIWLVLPKFQEIIVETSLRSRGLQLNSNMKTIQLCSKAVQTFSSQWQWSFHYKTLRGVNLSTPTTHQGMSK